MIPKNKIAFLVAFCTGITAFGQIEKYNYKRTLDAPTDLWHKIELPNEMYDHISPGFSDIRIFGITENNDTIEAPFLVRDYPEKTNLKTVQYTAINSSSTKKGKFITYEIANESPLNSIKINVNNLTNFDWKIRVEGSQDNTKWFTIVDDYRILSTSQKTGIYSFTTVSFPTSKYKYYRLLIKDKPNAKIGSAEIYYTENNPGKRHKYKFKADIVIDRKEKKTTEFILDFGMQLPVNRVNFEALKGNGFYRDFVVEYVTDSTETKTGWKYHYRTATRSTLSSLEPLHITFPTIYSNKLKITIFNRDNKPLAFTKVEVFGPEYDLIARFDEKANYFLVYGNSSARHPQYDIVRFENNIPKDLNNLSLGIEKQIEKAPLIQKEPLFKNKLWLWGIMAIIIITLGWFTIKMMRNES